MEDGRVVWKNRKVMGKGGGIATIALPAELKGWVGKFVEIECRSPCEIVVRLMPEPVEEQEDVKK